MRSLSLLASGLVCAAALACASSGSGADAHLADNARVTVRQAKSDVEFELVSGDSQARVDQYSTARESASTKVQSPEVMGELVKQLEELGFDDLAQSGSAPAQLGPDVVYAIEVATEAGTRFALETRGMPPEEREKVRAMVASMVLVWNETYSLQAVELQPGESPFEKPKPPQPR